jgi:uncharacterized protein (TIGR03083 family)
VITKEAVIPVLAAEWSAIDELLSSLTGEQWSAPTALPGWSVHDNVSHIIGVECALAGRSAPPCDLDVRSLPHVRNDLGAANEHWVLGLRAESPAAMIERFREITELRRKALEAMSQADFDAPSWTPVGRDTYGRFMRIRLFDCWMHEQDIRDAIGLAGNDASQCAEVSLAEASGALGYIVGKRAAAPDGATVTIELTGPLRATWHVAVDGRAALVDSVPEPPTTTLRLSSNLFTRLVGGRVPADAHLGEIAITGDTALGTRIATSLPVTI